MPQWRAQWEYYLLEAYRINIIQHDFSRLKTVLNILARTYDQEWETYLQVNLNTSIFIE